MIEVNKMKTKLTILITSVVFSNLAQAFWVNVHRNVGSLLSPTAHLQAGKDNSTEEPLSKLVLPTPWVQQPYYISTTPDWVQLVDSLSDHDLNRPLCRVELKPLAKRMGLKDVNDITDVSIHFNLSDWPRVYSADAVVPFLARTIGCKAKIHIKDKGWKDIPINDYENSDMWEHQKSAFYKTAPKIYNCMIPTVSDPVCQSLYGLRTVASFAAYIIVIIEREGPKKACMAYRTFDQYSEPIEAEYKDGVLKCRFKEANLFDQN